MQRPALPFVLIGVAGVIIANLLARATFLERSVFDPVDAPGIGFLAPGDLMALGVIAAGLLLTRLRQQAWPGRASPIRTFLPWACHVQAPMR